MHEPTGVRRRSIRLPARDYKAGWYFVTLCVQGKVCLFGEISDGRVILNPSGEIIADEWRELANRFPMVKLDAWVVMPNHLHGIVGLLPIRSDADGAQLSGVQQHAPTIAEANAKPIRTSKPLGQIVGAFKTATTRRVNAVTETTGERFWQRNFHEHVIRDAREMDRIRRYIQNNPAQWALDEENPMNSQPSR